MRPPSLGIILTLHLAGGRVALAAQPFFIGLTICCLVLLCLAGLLGPQELPPTETEPGNQFSYSSYGFNLLSAVIEGASRENFLSYIKREVFSPLGIFDTSPDKNDSIIVNRTSFYQLDSLNNIINAPYVDNSYKWAGGGFLSTTTDLIKFGEAHFTPGFLSATTLNELTTSQVLNNGDSTGYGIGWSVLKKENHVRGFGHGGGSVGGITQFMIYPTDKLVIVLLSNSSNTTYGNVVDRIIEMFLNAKNNRH